MAKKEPQPQRQLFTAIHSANIEAKTSKRAGPLHRLSLIFSIQDPDWLAWYVFNEGYEPGKNAFDRALTEEGIVLDSEQRVGGSREGFPFSPTKPRMVGDFALGPPGAYSIQPRARLRIQRQAQDPRLLKVGMTVFLRDGPENLTWPRVPTFGGLPEMEYWWGYVIAGPRDELLKGLRSGIDRFRLPTKAARTRP